jgi:hypothetical protein
MSAYMPHAHFRVFGFYESGFMKDTRHVKNLCKWRVKEQRLIGAASRHGCVFLGRDRQAGVQDVRPFARRQSISTDIPCIEVY